MPVNESYWRGLERSFSTTVERNLAWLEGEVVAVDDAFDRAEDALDGQFKWVQNEMKRRLEADVRERLARDASSLPPEYGAVSLLRAVCGGQMLVRGRSPLSEVLAAHAALGTATRLASQCLTGGDARVFERRRRRRRRRRDPLSRAASAVAAVPYPTSLGGRAARTLRRAATFGAVYALTYKTRNLTVANAVVRATFAASAERTIASALPPLARSADDDRQEWYSAARPDASVDPRDRDRRTGRRFSAAIHGRLRRLRGCLRAARLRRASRRRRRRLAAGLEVVDDEDEEEWKRAAVKRRRVRSRAIFRGLAFARAFRATPTRMLLTAAHLAPPSRTGEPPPRHPESLIVTRSTLGAYELSRGAKAALRFARPWILEKLLGAVLAVREKRARDLAAPRPPSLAARVASGSLVAAGVAARVYAFLVAKSLPWVTGLGCARAGGFIGKLVYRRLMVKLPGAIVRAPLKLPRVFLKRARARVAALDADGDGRVDLEDFLHLARGRLSKGKAPAAGDGL